MNVVDHFVLFILLKRNLAPVLGSFFLCLGLTACTPKILTVSSPALSYLNSTGNSGVINVQMVVQPTTLNPGVGSALTSCRIKPGSINSESFPSYLSINPATCVISGTPTSPLSSTPFTIEATNNTDLIADASVTLYVSSCDDLATPYGSGAGTSLSPYLICNASHLQNIEINPNANFTLVTDIDLTNSSLAPIGYNVSTFCGFLDGGGHTLSNWTYVNLANAYPVGLFSNTCGTFQNLNLENFQISAGANNVGLLAGYLEGGTIQNCTVSGSVSGTSDGVGGLAGHAYPFVTSISIISSSSSADVTGIDRVGGLVGIGLITLLSDSHVTGNVTCPSATGNRCGGLLGESEGITISTSYYSGGIVSGNNGAGGLIGCCGINSFTDSYMTGTVDASSTGAAGGIIAVGGQDTFTRVFVAGQITGASGSTGGIVGTSGGTDTSTGTFWDNLVTTQSTGGAPSSSSQSTAAMQTQSTYIGWDFVNTWYPPAPGHSYPTLR